MEKALAYRRNLHDNSTSAILPIRNELTIIRYHLGEIDEWDRESLYYGLATIVDPKASIALHLSYEGKIINDPALGVTDKFKIAQEIIQHIEAIDATEAADAADDTSNMTFFEVIARTAHVVMAKIIISFL